MYYGMVRLISLILTSLFIQTCLSSLFSTSTISTIRLNPGDDLKISLHSFMTDNNLFAASIIAAVGSLQKINLRLANTDNSIQTDEKYEIVSLSGTIARNVNTCEPDAHIHMSLADSNGSVIGGHVMEGNIVYTTIEITLACPNDLEYVREFDPLTGYDELVVHDSDTRSASMSCDWTCSYNREIVRKCSKKVVSAGESSHVNNGIID